MTELEEVTRNEILGVTSGIASVLNHTSNTLLPGDLVVATDTVGTISNVVQNTTDHPSGLEEIAKVKEWHPSGLEEIAKVKEWHPSGLEEIAKVKEWHFTRKGKTSDLRLHPRQTISSRYTCC